jgi:IMP cyclohydrolase
MNVYETFNIGELIKDNSYVGRGIVIGKSKDGTKAAIAYFIMGRSENSRNRIFLEDGDEVRTHPFDESKVSDPSLIIYSPIRKYNNKLIVTNGDQTDTIYDYIKNGKTFSDALDTRCFEPDPPNFTPRISGMLTFVKDDFSYEMSILKSADAEGSACSRYTFSYPSLPGAGHFIHTYKCDGNPIPTFCGEPERVEIPDDIDEFTKILWDNLNVRNRISLYVRYIDLMNGKLDNRMINKNIRTA